MKVKLSKNERDQIQLIVRKYKKMIAVSVLAENEVSLETDHINLDSVEYDPSLPNYASGFIVAWSRTGAYIIDLRESIYKEKSNFIVDGHRITVYKDEEMGSGLDLNVYYIPKTKEKNINSVMKSK
jgi:hypothetical protein